MQYQIAADRMFEIWNILQLSKGWGENSPRHESAHKMLRMVTLSAKRKNTILAW